MSKRKNLIGVMAGLMIWLVFGLGNYFVALRLYRTVVTVIPGISETIFIAASIILFLLMTLGFMRSILPIPVSTKGGLGWISAYGSGIFVYLLLLFLAADFLLFLARLTLWLPDPMPQSIEFYSGAIVVLLTTGLVCYGLYHARQVSHTAYDIHLQDTRSTNELNIVLISDIHLGAVNSEKRLPAIVQLINQMNPDIVCIAGDLFDDSFSAVRNPDKASCLLRQIKAVYGVYASLGNHDAGKTLDDMVHFLEQSQIHLLNDDYVMIDDRVVLVGRLDPSPIGGFGGLKRKGLKDLVGLVDTRLPIVVMDHTPAKLEQYGCEIDLVLSGHTHRGQMVPFNLITRAVFTTDYGYFRKDTASPHVVVTSGAGTWGPPMRIGSDNEIVSITLHWAYHSSRQTADQYEK